METPETIDLTTAQIRLTRDLRKAASEMGETEARILADIFETKQRDRIRNGNRVIALEKNGEPNSLLRHFHTLDETMESQIGAALKKYTEGHFLGQWMMAQKGCGPLIAARLLAFIDWNECHTPSCVWSFAGLVPGVSWEKGERRPWNARLKRLCWLLGESFVKNQGRKNAFYPDYFTAKKKEMWHRNASGGNRARALVLKDDVGEKTDAHRWYRGDVIEEVARKVAKGTWPAGKKPWADEPEIGVPMLPPAHIHAMARRWTVKLFLAHAWEVAWRANPENEGKECSPYAVEHMGHKDVIPAPTG